LKAVLQEFRTNPLYLNRYYASMSFVLAAASAFLLWALPTSLRDYLWYLPALVLMLVPRFAIIVTAFVYAVIVALTTMRASFHFGYLTLVPLSLYLALLATAYIHNAAHDNIRPRWLRRPIGELCGLFHLVGFPDWTIVHFIHHKHADDPEWDPHPPRGLTYFRFLDGVKASIFRVLRKRYFESFPDDTRAERAWKTLPLYAMAAQILRTHFWFFLLGPQVFTFLFMTSIVAKNLHYAFFNYATHVPSQDDPNEMVIVNLNHSFFFRGVNALSHGLYFHANHHQNPNLFDPRALALAKPEPQLERNAA
jgi:fatty acid desaturase